MQKYFNTIIILLTAVLCLGCEALSQKVQKNLFLGADLSYANEMEDCGVAYLHLNEKVDPFQHFANEGANLIRLRLWHSPDWTSYGTLADIKRSISKAKQNGMQVLLDFHYSDSWADPAHQIVPAAWANIESQTVLGDSVYNYTTSIITQLHAERLLPEIVQIGNEVNSEILMKLPADENQEMNWERQSFLLNKGLSAIRDFNLSTGNEIKTVIHVAQPENTFYWLKNAQLIDYDFIGLSYYPKWSTYNLDQLSNTIASLKTSYHKDIMVVETGYPYSADNFDEAGNVLDGDGALNGYPISPEGQLSFMIDLTNSVVKGGGSGVIYWEPAWMSSDCKTRWGTGSHWENATFFDARSSNSALPVFQFLNHNYFN